MRRRSSGSTGSENGWNGCCSLFRLLLQGRQRSDLRCRRPGVRGRYLVCSAWMRISVRGPCQSVFWVQLGRASAERWSRSGSEKSHLKIQLSLVHSFCIQRNPICIEFQRYPRDTRYTRTIELAGTQSFRNVDLALSNQLSAPGLLCPARDFQRPRLF